MNQVDCMLLTSNAAKKILCIFSSFAGLLLAKCVFCCLDVAVCSRTQAVRNKVRTLKRGTRYTCSRIVITGP